MVIVGLCVVMVGLWVVMVGPCVVTVGLCVVVVGLCVVMMGLWVVMIGLCVVMVGTVDVMWSYEIEFRWSEVRWASRWNVYLDMADLNIHWFSVINSVVVVFFLAGQFPFYYLSICLFYFLI